MLAAVIAPRFRGAMVVALLALALVMGPLRAERLGDRLQVALPLIGWGCAAMNGGAVEYAGRFLLLEIGIHGTKRALGDAAINQRPAGGGKGMPSGHTAAASFGASALAHDCVKGHPVARGAAIIAAAFTGSSRIEAGAHSIWQVLLGALWGLFCDRALRRNRRMRGAVSRGFGALGAPLRYGAAKLRPKLAWPEPSIASALLRGPAPRRGTRRAAAKPA